MEVFPAGIKVRIWLTRLRVQGSTLLSSKAQSSLIQTGMKLAFMRTIAPCERQDTGEFPSWSTRASHFSGRIGLTCLFGD
jgi:hypothetical protein